MEAKEIKKKIKNTQRVFFCPMCGTKFSYRHDGEKERPICDHCQYIHYENPAVGVAAVVLDENNRILLGLRNRGRKSGLWCIPCGYVDYEEDIYDAVVREFKEETNLDVEVERLLDVHSNFFYPDKHSVGIWFLARRIGGELQAKDDLDDVGYFPLNDLPDMAFENDLKIIEKIKSILKDADAGA